MSAEGSDNTIDLRSRPNGGIVLSVRALTKNYEIRRGLLQRTVPNEPALDCVSLDLKRGSTLAVVGESGGGKSTLTRCVAGLERPTGGGVFMSGLGGVADDGQPGPADVPVHRLGRDETRLFHRRCQLVTQDPTGALNPKQRIGDLIARSLKAHGRTDRTLETQAVSALEEVGLGAADLHRYPADFSTGQLQRIAIARALALDPHILVLDEPTSAVDVSSQAHILNLLARLQRDRGLTYLLITHELPVARHLADYVAVIRTGQVVEAGPADTVFGRPIHPYTRLLISADPEFEPGV